VSEGFVDFRGYRTWYRVTGEPSAGSLPLLCLHGGPGSSHAYFGPLEHLPGRQVVVYDQLGCGDSDRPDDVEWSVELFVDEVDAVLDALGPGAGDEEYHAAHFCRLDPPQPEQEQWQAKRNVAVYEAMWGPNEWTCDGVLAGSGRRDRLGEIRVPTLVLSGRYDACTPAIAETLARGIPDAEHVLFEHSAHIPFVDERERYRAVLTDFLRHVER
jgi:pimeloyl-ACP methyl ester carboxylesterase